MRRVIGAAFLGIAASVAVAVVITHWGHGAQGASSLTPTPGGHFLVTTSAPRNATVEAVVRKLQGGSYVTIAPGSISNALGPNTRTVVFTRAAFNATSQATLLSIYLSGALIVALDVSIPDMRAILDPSLADTTQGNWLPTSAGYTLYSMERHAVRGPISERSDILRDVAIFYNETLRKEAGPTFAR
jgi:hypothetical protein